MDIYAAVLDYLSVLPMFHTWPELDTILRRSAALHPRDWKLPIGLCQALRKLPQEAIPASAALACMQISIILVDDMLDSDLRGEYRRIGYGPAANLALAFQAASLEALSNSTLEAKVRSEAGQVLGEMMLKTAFGQALDVKNPSNEVGYWRVVQNKSAPFHGCAFRLGAVFAEATNEVAQGVQRLGELYGEMIQIHDDVNDTLAIPAGPDWLEERCPLPILYAQTVNHPERKRFLELRGKIATETALCEAQDILIRSGAISYCLDQLLRRHHSAQEILCTFALPAEAVVRSLLNELISPVERLFTQLGLHLQAG